MELEKNDIKFKYDFNTLEGIESDIFPPNFCCALIGKPGSGKTTLLRQLLLEPDLLFQKYEYVFILSPSIEEFPFVMNSDSMTNKFDMNWIYTKLKGIKEKKHVNILLVIDDYVSYLRELRNDPYLMSLFFNRRHIVTNGTISIIITSQRYMSIPHNIRSTINILFLFPMTRKDLETVWTEHINMSRKKFFSLSSLEDHKFLVCNIQDSKYYLEFDRVVFSQS